MSDNNKCTGGSRTYLEILPDTGECKCIKNAVFNPNGTLTINFTDGTSVTSASLKGADGATGATGPMASNLVHSDPDDHLTTNTSTQTLSTFTTDQTNALKTLQAKGDNFEAYACLEITANDGPFPTGIQANFLINGAGITNNIASFQITVNASEAIIELWAIFTLKTATAGDQRVQTQQRGRIWKDKLNPSISRETAVIYTDMGSAGTDFNTNNYTISVQAKSKSAGDVTLKNFTVKKNKKI